MVTCIRIRGSIPSLFTLMDPPPGVGGGEEKRIRFTKTLSWINSHLCSLPFPKAPTRQVVSLSLGGGFRGGGNCPRPHQDVNSGLSDSHLLPLTNRTEGTGGTKLRPEGKLLA